MNQDQLNKASHSGLSSCAWISGQLGEPKALKGWYMPIHVMKLIYV